MNRSCRPLLATLSLVAALACAAPVAFAEEAKPAAPAAPAPEKKAELSPEAKALLETLRAMSAAERQAHVAELDAQIKLLAGQAPQEIINLISGLRDHTAALNGTLDAIEAAKAAKDEAKAAEQEKKLQEQAVAFSAFFEQNKHLLGDGEEGEAPEALPVGAEAPALNAKVVSGDAVSLKFADHKGKPVVVEFWATWCPPCRDSIPHIDALWEKHKDKAVFVGITDETEAEVKAFVAQQKSMRYPVAVDQGGTGEAFKVNGIPHAFIVVDGKVVWEGHPMAGLDAALEKALGEKKDGEKKEGEKKEGEKKETTK